MFASIDIETTGLNPKHHEIIQIGILPLDKGLQISTPLFYTNIRPNHPERCDITAKRVHALSMEELCLHAPDPDTIMELLIEWQEKLGYRPVPISHNWPFERAFLVEWLGQDLLESLFDTRARDTMAVAAAINDRAVMNGEDPIFERLTLGRVCRKLNITNENSHDALSDAMACAEAYKRMLKLNW